MLDRTRAGARLSSCLAAAGVPRLSVTQAQAYGPLSRGEDVVLAAETGSGKTLAYLVPLIERLMVAREREQAEAEAGAGSAEDGDQSPGTEQQSSSSSLDIYDAADVGMVDEAVHRGVSVPFVMNFRSAVLVLCPNALLCEQVVSVVERTFDDAVRCLYVSSQSISYDNTGGQFPDVVVTTPVALHSLLTGVGPMIGPEWTFEGLNGWARYVVLDEADMLLSGAYGKKIEHVLEALRGGDRERAARRACEEVGIDLERYWDLPRGIRKGAQLGGGAGMVEAGLWGALGESPRELGESGVWLRQYAFVAATMPVEGRETVGAKIAYAYPEAVWVRGGSLHMALRQVAFRWLDVGGGVDAQVRGLVGVIEEDLRNTTDGHPLRMMVFTKDTAASKGVAARLKAAFDVEDSLFDIGEATTTAAATDTILIVSYHKGMRQEDRADALRALRDETRPIVLVCTDSTARGLDVPGVSHVVHADFPASAIDFIHRSGRTGRAGAGGVVTSLVGSESFDLAEAIKDLIEGDDPLEGAFSRNRSFRKKHKKYGRFVKRGEVG